MKWRENNIMSDYSFHSFEVAGEKLTAMGKWKYLALHNELTNLPNRRMFYMSIESYMVRAHQLSSKLAIGLMNISQLKDINNMFGYSAGDDFLIELSNRFAALSEFQIQAFHLDGASFMLLIEQADDNLQGKISQVTTVLDRPFHINGDSIFIDESIGFSLYPDHSMDAKELFAYAEKAQAKALEGSRFCIFQPDMNK